MSLCILICNPLSSSGPTPFLKANDFGVDFFFLIDNEFKVLEENVEVVFVETKEWEQTENSRSSIAGCL